MLLRDIGDLPSAITTEQFASLLECSRGAVWAAGRDEGGIVVGGELIPPLRVGRALRWPTSKIVAALGLARDVMADTGPAPAPSESQSPAERGSARPEPGTVHDHRQEVSCDGSA